MPVCCALHCQRRLTVIALLEVDPFAYAARQRGFTVFWWRRPVRGDALTQARATLIIPFAVDYPSGVCLPRPRDLAWKRLGRFFARFGFNACSSVLSGIQSPC